MNHAGNLPAVLCLDRNTVTAIAHSNHRILEIGAHRAIHHRSELGMYLVVGMAHRAAELKQRRAGVVAQFIFRDDTAADF